jgi:DNA-3-methyladenine glycosylase II
MTLTTISETLVATPPFDFAQSLHFLANFAPTSTDQTITSTAVTKAISVNGTCVVFRLTSNGTIEQPELLATLFSGQPLSSSVKQAVMERISFYLSLNDDLAPFYDLARADPNFAPTIDRLYGLHHVKFLTLCEIACWSVLTQHLAIPAARKMRQALVEAYGSSLTVDGQVYWAFPERERLAAAGIDELATLIKDERRATYLHGVIAALGEIDEEFLRTAPYDEAEAALRSIKGIGPWSAAFILLRGLGRMERMLLDLKPFLRALPKVYGESATMKQLEERYGRWFGYWGFYFRAAN